MSGLTPAEAEARGYKVDRCCYPWVGYKGPRFKPGVTVRVLTDHEAALLAQVEKLTEERDIADSVWTRLSVLVGCTSPSGDAELDQVQYAYERARAAEESRQWRPIGTSPRDGSWILLRGESGYIERPYRVNVGRWDSEYRPLSPWQTSESCSFEDDGDPPTHWMPLPNGGKP